ncbi:Endonuclease MutS2 [subsurface metagenome]
MIFPSSFENKIGFDRIRQMISDYCMCVLGRDRAESMSFEESYEKVCHELNLTDELRKVLLFEENFPQENYIDMSASLEKMKVEGTHPETSELNDLRKSIHTIKSLEHFFHSEEIREKYKMLCAEFSGLNSFPFVGKQLENILDKQGEIKDNASSELKLLRDQKKQKQASVTRRLQSILKSAQKEGIVEMGTEITIREGRPVIPLLASNKRKLGGLVHDESASGKTVFVEPGAIVELNNELRELTYAERREIIKILIHFANDIRPYIDKLLDSYQSLGVIDFLGAKAKLALKIKAVRPILNTTANFKWKNAIHPLLYLSHKAEGKEVVPLDIQLNEKDRIILISGPNAGGKSVCLKTVGLLQYMLQCGLLVPMSENAEVCLFKNIFIDIGDEQSLENDLSTYSSHLLNMKYFVKKTDSQTLILIDEFGTGTEPTLGGAIAEAILEELKETGSYGVITTHYANLKYFASESAGIINGAMLFDTQKIKPLFRLSIGKPGSSFAIDIARNIGMPEKILKKASEKTGKDHINFEKHLREIIRDKKYWGDKRQRIRKVEKTLDYLYENYSGELEKIQKERKKILAEAQNEAKDVLKEANKQIERTIREIKESNAHKDKTRKAREELEKYKKQIADNNNAPDQLGKKLQELRNAGKRLVKHSAELEISSVNKNKKKEIRESTIKKGDQIRIKGLESTGEVIEVNEKTYLVAFGSMMTTVEHSRVELVKGDRVDRKKEARKSYTSNFKQRKLNFKPEIDIRGMRGDEALLQVQNFIDDALVVAVHQVKILHGKGDGILRQLIRDYLNTIEVVRSIKDEHADRGGAGITMVELDL